MSTTHILSITKILILSSLTLISFPNKKQILCCATVFYLCTGNLNLLLIIPVLFREDVNKLFPMCKN